MPDRSPLPDSPALRAARLRPTAARVAVLNLLERSPHPLQADTVFRQLSGTAAGLALGTVYRALRELEDAHLVQREWHEEPCGSRKATYRLRGGDDPQRSVQLVCMACGQRAFLPDSALHRQLVQAAAAAGMALPAQPLVLQVAHCGCTPPNEK